MRISGGRRTRRPGASSLDELERIDEALGRYRHLVNLRTFVDGRPSPTVTLASAAQGIGISRSHLARLLHEKVGTSFQHWLTLKRVYAAMVLMQAPVTLIQAAHLSGFASYRSFARAFKDVVGVSPSAYRKQLEPGPRRDFATN